MAKSIASFFAPAKSSKSETEKSETPVKSIFAKTALPQQKKAPPKEPVKKDEAAVTDPGDDEEEELITGATGRKRRVTEKSKIKAEARKKLKADKDSKSGKGKRLSKKNGGKGDSDDGDDDDDDVDFDEPADKVTAEEEEEMEVDTPEVKAAVTEDIADDAEPSPPEPSPPLAATMAKSDKISENETKKGCPPPSPPAPAKTSQPASSPSSETSTSLSRIMAQAKKKEIPASSEPTASPSKPSSPINKKPATGATDSSTAKASNAANTDTSTATNIKAGTLKPMKLKQAKSSSTKSSVAEKKSTTYAKSIKSDELLDSSGLEEGKPIPYLELCGTLQKIESISSRLEIQGILTDFFRKVMIKNPADLIHCVYLAANDVAPSYDCVELGVGESFLIKAIGEANGVETKQVKAKLASIGDLGLVAETSKAKQKTLFFANKPKPVSVEEVLTCFRKVAKISGTGTQTVKIAEIKKLLVRCSSTEAKFLIRGLQGKLRIGLAKSSVLVSIAHTFIKSKKFDDESVSTCSDEEKKMMPEEHLKLFNGVNNSKKPMPLDEQFELGVAIIKKAHSELPNYDEIIKGGLSAPLYKLYQTCCLRPGIPVEPMLAKPEKSVLNVLKRLTKQRFTCEYKYDGERAQVHMTEDGSTAVFSRNLLNTTEKFPEVPDYVMESCESTGVTSFVMDSEVVAYNSETDTLVPFQVLSTRKKKGEADGEEAKVKIIVQAFDLMFLNGKSLLNKTLFERRELLRKHFKPVENKFRFAVSLDHTENGDTDMIEEFLDKAVKGQCEGLMVKTLDDNARYEPSKRSLNWLKLKKDYLEGLGDSVDLVPIGAFYGKGKRTGTYGAYLLAVYDEPSDSYQSVCKIGTGFSDENLVKLMEGFQDNMIDEPAENYVFGDSLKCDVWLEACQVWEVMAADLSTSSTHKGALGRVGEGEGRGIGLRFPRFERVRPDKKPEQATNSDQIRDMFYAQDSMVEQKKDAEYDSCDEL